MSRRILAALTLSLPLFGQNPTATVTVDAAQNRRAINPAIYGVAYATTAQLDELNAPVHRSGGNNTSRYNWQINADNRGFDWYFESIPEASATAGERGNTFIANSRAANSEPMITIPMIGWVGKLGAGRSKLASFSIAKYGAQTGNDWQWMPDAGNGIRTSGGYVTGNDPNDANVPNSSAFQRQWVQAIVNQWGAASAGGLKYYILDNEHSIWHSTHRDVQPTGATMEQIRDRILDYATQIRAVDPSAKIVGPEEWGWSGYIFSGYDQQWGSINGWSNLPDRVAHGNMDYIPWLLQQLKASNALDVFTLHFYPQGGEFSDDTSTAMQQRRNRSTRALWDPSYVDETWIGTQVQLIPRMKNWVNTYYNAGAPIGLTEYNWGAENHINGATTQADIYGIFGREGLDIGARWTTPATTTPTYKAMKMYRNYDGNKSTFGDVSVRATTATSPDNVSVFAAERTSDGAMTVMVVSKYLSNTTPVSIGLQNFSAGTAAKAYRLTSSNAITQLADIAVSGGSVAFSAPAQSITLLVIPKSGVVNQPPTAAATATPSSGAAPLAVTFNGAGSSDSDGAIASYAWNFGDGTTGSGVSTSKTYAAAGTYNAVLTVTDNLGATATAGVTVTVTADPNQINAPSNLTGSGKKGSATLNWVDNSSNETGFAIERAPGTSGGTFVQVGAVGANVRTFTQSGVARGAYRYRVKAYNATASSAYSNTVTVNVR